MPGSISGDIIVNETKFLIPWNLCSRRKDNHKLIVKHYTTPSGTDTYYEGKQQCKGQKMTELLFWGRGWQKAWEVGDIQAETGVGADSSLGISGRSVLRWKNYKKSLVSVQLGSTRMSFNWLFIDEKFSFQLQLTYNVTLVSGVHTVIRHLDNLRSDHPDKSKTEVKTFSNQILPIAEKIQRDLICI